MNELEYACRENIRLTASIDFTKLDIIEARVNVEHSRVKWGSSLTFEKRPWATAKNDPIVVLHSSGSTGIPKPITMTHGTFSILDNERKLPGVSGRKKRDFSIWDLPNRARFYHIFPYFHLAGFLSNIVNPVFTESSSPVLGPPLQPPSGDLLKAIMKSQPLKALYIPPAIAEQVLQEPALWPSKYTSAGSCKGRQGLYGVELKVQAECHCYSHVGTMV